MDVTAVMVYSVFDRKLREFGQLATSKNDESVRRALVDGLRSPGGAESTMGKHPEDFDLMRVGEWFPESGFLAPVVGKPVLVCNVAELLEAERPDAPVRLRAEG